MDGDRDSVIEGGETVISKNNGTSQYRHRSREVSAQSPIQSSIVNEIQGENNSLDRYQVTKNDIDMINENDKEEVNSFDGGMMKENIVNIKKLNTDENQI